LQWRKTSIAVTQGTLIHYSLNKSGVYVYGRIKDNHRVMVLLNGSLTDQTLKTDRFSDLIGNYKSGKDVITSQVLDITKSITIPAKGEYILELGN
jgi:hypothetical protein